MFSSSDSNELISTGTLSAVSWPLRRVLVHGPSMAPTLRGGDQLLVWLRPPRRVQPGRVVLVELPDRGLGVKRVARTEDDRVWVVGDNEFATTDSRDFGALPVAAVRGRVL